MTRWNETLLDEMRQLGDPAADKVISDVFARGQVGAVNALLVDLVSNEELPGAAAYPELREFLVATARLPDWADMRRVGAGEQLFLEWGLASISVLACASLPECYVLGDVAAVLGRTQELEAHVTRRMPETVMMVLAVMDPGGLGPQGSGIRVTQKVRLMHAAVRHLVLHAPPAESAVPPTSLGEACLAFTWDSARGQPISQEDLAAVILTFSHVVLRGWRDLGIEISPDQEDAYIHCWNVVGHVLGIHDRFLALDPADARDLFEAIKRHRVKATRDGRELTRSLLDYSESFAPEPRVVFRPVSRILMHSLLDRETCAHLDVPGLTALERVERVLLLWLVWVVNAVRIDLFHKVPGAGGLASVFAAKMLGDLVEVTRGGSRPPFQIPDGLAKKWNVARKAKPPE